MITSSVLEIGTYRVPIVLIEVFLSWDDGYENVIETLIPQDIENFKFTIHKDSIIIYRETDDKEFCYKIDVSKNFIKACNSLCTVFCEFHFFVCSNVDKLPKEQVFFGLELFSHKKAIVHNLKEPRFCVRVKDNNEVVSFYKRSIENV